MGMYSRSACTSSGVIAEINWAWAVAGIADLGGGGFLGRVGDQPGGVVWGGGMGV